MLGRSMLDLCDLVRFFAKCLKKINPVISVSAISSSAANSMHEGDKHTPSSRNIFGLMVETLSQMGNKLLNADPLQTEVFFLEYGADEILDVMVDNQFKLNEMTVLLYCFI